MNFQSAVDELNQRGYALNLWQYSLKHEGTLNKGRPLWDATAHERATGRMALFGFGPTWEAALAQLMAKIKGEWTPPAEADPFDFEEDPLA